MLQEHKGKGGKASGGTTPDEGTDRDGVELFDPGVLEVRPHGERRGVQPPEDIKAGVGHEATPDRSEEEDGGDEASQPEEEDGVEVQEPGVKKRKERGKTIHLSDIIQALRLSNGNITDAARILGKPHHWLVTRIKRDPQLSATVGGGVANPHDPEIPSATQVAGRKPLPLSIIDTTDALAVRAQNTFILNNGLIKSGVKRETLELLDTVGSGLFADAGATMMHTLTVHHSMMVVSNVKLFELADQIKTEYLDNPACPPAIKLEWARVYRDITETLQNGYDRAWSGTNALAKLMAAGKDSEDGKPKPGFKPLAPRSVNG